ncbi:MAG: response regulator [Candidatus Obscuribacterales bacterium]|jgi:CheY-like chemotaxis protein
MNHTDAIKNVLLVDDDTNITFLTKLTLDGLTDWTVMEASSGAQALQIVESFIPDLILLDAMMPGMDGRTTYAKFREIPALDSTYIIFVTAKIQADEIGQFCDLGAEGVITKPFDPMTLVEEIERVISQAKTARVK